MVLIPRVGENEVVGADQFQVSVWSGLVNYDLGTRGIQHTTVHQVSVYVVEPHCARFGSAHAPELKGVALGLSHPNVLESLGRLPDYFDESAGILLLVRCQ